MPATLDATLARFFTRTAPVLPGQGLVVAFSGGPDSTALLATLAAWPALPGPSPGCA